MLTEVNPGKIRDENIWASAPHLKKTHEKGEHVGRGQP